jgi:hypothetical protein
MNFFRSLLTVNWYNEVAPNGKAQWMRHHFPTIMLNTDMTISYDANVDMGVGQVGQICGPTGRTYLEGQVLAEGESAFGCSPDQPYMPPTCSLTCQYANNNCFFLDKFVISWNKMVSAGYGTPPNGSIPDSVSSGGKLGTLTNLKLDTCWLVVQ